LWVPLTHEAFVESHVNGVELSATGIEVLKRRLAGEEVNRENSGLSKRDWDELQGLFGL
jgi:thymidylate synthase (FAD)